MMMVIMEQTNIDGYRLANHHFNKLPFITTTTTVNTNHVQYNFFHPTAVVITIPRKISVLKSSILDDIEDEEELVSFRSIASSYLKSKFLDCYGDDCTYIRNRDDVKQLLRSVLPPLSSTELDDEVDKLLKNLPSSDIDADEFLREVINNSFWRESGVFVVKELILLDCIHTYYYKKRSLLSDDEYNELKDSLSWEGSVAVTLTAKEAHFISAVSAFRRGTPILDDVGYGSLKSDLQKDGSWVVNRQMDPLEKLGISTFMAYLHRSL